MKKIKKICNALLIIFCITLICASGSTVQAESTVESTISSIGSGTAAPVGGIKTVISTILGMIRLLTGLLSIVVIAYTGFEMVVETPEGKKKVKEKMVPIVVGVVLVFMASTIASFIIGVFEGSSTTNNSSGGGGGNPTSQSAVK